MKKAKWTPESWRQAEGRQMPLWPDAAKADAVEAEMRSYPPLVFAGETRLLKDRLADVVAGRAPLPDPAFDPLVQPVQIGFHRGRLERDG